MPLGIFEKKKHQPPSAVSGSSSQDRDMKGHTFLVGRHAVTVERKLAEGGFAIVYVVRCNRSNRLFALKRQFVNDQKQLDACKREIQIIKSLSDHKNMVTYVDSCISPAGEGVFECMMLTQYYRYSVLALMNDRLVKGKGLRVEEILRIFCDVCEAVSRLHHSQTPVIHRDLKVENILIDDRGTFVLCDFGSATTKVLSAEKQSHSVVEEEILKYTTLSYRAPEMVDLYSAKPITTKSDIWALGVMLYKLCYFSLPFGESALAIQNGSFAFPDQPDYFPELKALIRYLLEPDCDGRPDIYQASSIAFTLSGRKCPVPNLNEVAVTDITELLKMLAMHNQRANDRSSDSPPSNGSVGGGETASATTTVAPRLRPKGKTTEARLPLPHKAITPWKTPQTDRHTSPAPHQPSTPPLDSVTMPESSSNPDLASGSGGSNQVTPSQSLSSALNASIERVPVLHRPEDLGFRDLEGPFPESPFHPVEPPEGPLVSLSPPEEEEKDQGGMGSGAPSQSAPHLPPPPSGGFLESPSTPVRSHRRNVSDTSAVFGGDASRPSAFKPYRSSQPDVNAVGEALRKQEMLEMTLLSGEVVVESTSASVSPSDPKGGSTRQDQRTQSANEATAHSSGDRWNPFSNAPGFERQRKAHQMDDLSFGESFDALPRSSQRKGSFSSTCNVKSSESLVMIIDEKDPFGAAPFNPPSRGSSAHKARTPKDHHIPKAETDGTKGDGAKQTEASQSALSTLASSIKQTNRYKKLIDTDDELEAPQESTPERAAKKSSDRLEVPNDDHYDSDSVGSASDLQKRMEMTSTDDSTGATSEPEDTTPGADRDDQNITYEHLDIGSSDSHPESAEMTGELRKEEEEILSDRNSDDRSKDPGMEFHPYFLNSETVDGLGHRPLLEDDELDEKNQSLPKTHPEFLELNVMNLSAELAGKTSLAESTAPQVLNINVEAEDIQSPQSNDTLCNMTPSSPEPLQTPNVESYTVHQEAGGAPKSTAPDKLPGSTIKEATPPGPVIITIPSPARTKKTDRGKETKVSPLGGPTQQSPDNPKFPETDAFGAVPLQTVVRSPPPASTNKVPSPPPVSPPVRQPSPSTRQVSPPSQKIVPVRQEQPRPSGILVGKKSPSPVILKRSTGSPSVRSQPMETIGSSSGDEDELYLSGGSRSSSRKGLSKKKARAKGGPGRHRHAVDDGGEEELVSGSPPPPAPPFPAHPVIPKRKNKEKARDKKSKTGGEVDAAFVNTSFQLEDVDFCPPPSPSVAS